MDTPIPTAIFIFCYLSWVVVLGPLFMRDRKPFSLRNTLIYYNAFQVTLSAYMFYEVRILDAGKAKNWILKPFSILVASDVRMDDGLQLYVRTS